MPSRGGGESRVGVHGLDEPCCVPGLDPVGAVTEHAFVLHPEVVTQAIEMGEDGRGAGPVVDEAGEGVEGGVDGSEAGVFGVEILVADEVPGSGFGTLFEADGTEKGKPEVDEEEIDDV